jgi:lipopolysaccharide/colanic/teichoic acid biosynthesis glycosyltransferase
LTPTPGSWLRWRVRVDRGAALVGLLLAAPLLLVLAVLVVACDRHAPLVGLPRVGRDGRTFTLWKVRTMRAGGDGGPVTVQDDERITALGARLRRSRLDELPQLWNVARGEMALLGPRPETPEYVDLRSAAWQLALSTPPGIAGATQVVVHGWESRLRDVGTYRDEVLPRKLEIDGWYVAHASPAVDLDVLRSLLRSVRTPDATTVVHRRLAAALPATMAAVAAGAAP